MASTKKLQGITIEIDGNTTKLSDSLKSVNKTIASTSSELKNINSLLKLDPTNTTLLAQKQQVLGDTIKATAEKLSQLKKAQQDADTSGVDKNSEAYRELEREIIATESKMSSLGKDLSDTDKAMSDSANSVNKLKKSEDDAGNGAIKFGDLLKANLLSEAIKKGLETLADSMKKVGNAVIDLGKQSLESYADYQQLVGGVETLFKSNSDELINYANNAYKTSGMSANDYMETVTSFSASLISSLGGDTSKAVKASDQAITDMSDNANKMGTDISSIQSAYQGFAKQNYTMLDNLKLGYGGTKTEMERLLKDAEKISGQKYDISNLNDVYSAIHVVQTELGITGTTAKEAGTTISGSVNSMKSAWSNLLTGIADENANIEELITNLVTSLFGDGTDSNLGVVGNVLPVVQTIIEQIPVVIQSLLPQLVEAGVNILQSLIEGIGSMDGTLATTIIDSIGMLISAVVNMLPQILELGINLLVSLAEGIAESLPDFIQTIIDVVLQLIQTITDHLPEIIIAGIDILVALVQGIADALPQLISALPEVITTIITTLTQPDMLEKLITAGIQLLVALGKGLIQAIPQVVKLIPTIIKNLFNSFKETVKNTDWLKLGKNVLQGILDGMLDFGDVVEKAIKKVGKKITNSIKSFFGIKSPSRLMKKEVGKYLAQGIALGFADEIPNTVEDVQNSLSELNTGIQASVNPTINPTANTNPLIIQIENFNNSRETDIQALAEELEFYRKNSSLAVGGN